MEENYKFRHVNEITGTFVIFIVVALIAAIVWTGRSQHWFRSNVTLRIVLSEAGAAGIRQGSEVYFLGTLVGTVSDVIVYESGRMEARTRIRRDFFLFVRADSSAVVKKKFGVAGDSYFEITRGKGKSLPEADASIACKEQLANALESAVDEIRRETLLVLKKTSAGFDTWTVLGSNLITSRDRLDQLIVRVDSLADGLEQGKGTVGRLLNDTAMADEAQKLMARVNEVMSELRDVVTNLNVAVKSVRLGTARLPEITDAMANEAQDLPGLVQQTQVSMRELERLIEAMQRHWFLRKYVNKTNPPRLGPWPASQEPEAKPARPVSGFRSPKASAR